MPWYPESTNTLDSVGGNDCCLNTLKSCIEPGYDLETLTIRP